MEKLIFTNDKCTGCNKCIRTCPVLLANDASVRGFVSVDPDKCIACGACFDACTHDARDYADDTDRFFADLASGKRFPLYWLQPLWQIIQRNISRFWVI